MKLQAPNLTITVIIALLISSCSTSSIEEGPPSTPTEVAGEPHIVISGIELSWPELVTTERCPPNDIQPEIKFCVLNEGTQAGAVPEVAYLMLPAGAAPDAVGAILNSLPGGGWGRPEHLVVSGLPGVNGEIQTMLIPQTPEAAEMEFFNTAFICAPTPQGCIQSLLLYHQPVPGGQGEGLWVGPKDPTGLSQVMGIVVEDKPGVDGSNGIIIVNTMPAGDEQGIIVVDSMPAEGEQGIIVVDSMPAEGEQGIIVVDSMPVGEWGARGIIVVDSMPGPGESAEGIIVVDSMPGGANLSHVMGIIMEDKPADDGSEGIIIVDTMPVEGQEGIIIVNTMPAEGQEGIIIVNTMPTGGQEGIIIVNTMPATGGGSEGIPAFDLPFGFDPQGMTAMMGEGSHGPGPKLLIQLDLSELGLPGQLTPGEEACVPLQLQVLTGGSGDFFVDSFFDVFVEIDVSLPPTDEAGKPETARFPVPTPPYARCTPTPTPTTIFVPPTPTPRIVIPPTPTIRTGLPTNPPPATREAPPPTRSSG